MHSSMLRMASTVLLLSGLLVGFGAAEETGSDGPDTGGAKKKAASTAGKQPKRIWAQSYLFCDAPKLEVSEWLTEKPYLEGKFVLIEFWRTWCGACKRAVPKMNSFHEKFGKELVVIAITGQPKDVVETYKGPKMNYYMAIDASPAETEEQEQEQEQEDEVVIKDRGATEEKYGVWGWPHVVLLEPEHHCVIWEGYPDLKGHELTAEKIEKALAIGRKRKKEEKK